MSGVDIVLAIMVRISVLSWGMRSCQDMQHHLAKRAHMHANSIEHVSAALQSSEVFPRRAAAVAKDAGILLPARSAHGPMGGALPLG